MNETWKNCLTSSVDVVYLNYKQLVALTIVDSALLTANAVTNTLVIYVLIKTGQLASVSCKFILQLSFTDILIENKITKLCSRIMLLLVFFLMPFIIVSIVRSKIRDELNTQSRALLEYVYRFSLLFAYSNSIANALLFLSTNTRAKRFLIRKLGFEKNRRPNNIQIRENQIVPN